MSADALHAIVFATQREQQISRSLEHANGYDAVMSQLPDKLGALRAATTALESTGVPYALIGGP